jgi:hypothetical protein
VVRWVRARGIFGGLPALFALALQLTLSFGNIHEEDIFGPAHVAPATTITLPADYARPLPLQVTDRS